MMAILPERVGKVDMTPAWWENALVVVSPVGKPVGSREDAAGKKVSVYHASFGLQRMQQLFPEAVAVPFGDYRAVVSSVCTGTVAAAVMETRLANSLQFLDDCRGKQLTMKWFPELNLRYAVAARKGLGPVANELFEEMMRMSQDGSMTRIGEPWGVNTSNQHNSVARLAEAQLRSRFWLYASAMTAGQRQPRDPHAAARHSWQRGPARGIPSRTTAETALGYDSGLRQSALAANQRSAGNGQARGR